jgi:hypothetical protein
MAKIKVNISLDMETADKMKELAKISHTTVSQWITNKVWETVQTEKMKQTQTANIINN